MYVADSLNNRVRVIEPEGAYRDARGILAGARAHRGGVPPRRLAVCEGCKPGRRDGGRGVELSRVDTAATTGAGESARVTPRRDSRLVGD